MGRALQHLNAPRLLRRERRADPGGRVGVDISLRSDVSGYDRVDRVVIVFNLPACNYCQAMYKPCCYLLPTRHDIINQGRLLLRNITIINSILFGTNVFHQFNDCLFSRMQNCDTKQLPDPYGDMSEGTIFGEVAMLYNNP